MARIGTEFDGYRLWYYSNGALFALVDCYKETVLVGRISFFKEGDTVPPNVNLLNEPSIHFAASRFNDVMTILKQKKPLYLFLNPETLAGTVANTHFEWTGEEEVVEEKEEATLAP
jgi:hypothetical protein